MTAAARALPTLSVRPLARNAAGDPVYEVAGGKSPHTVLLAATGPICDCPDFRFRKHTCKHIRAVHDEQEAAARPPAPAGNGRHAAAAEDEDHRPRFKLLGPETLLTMPAPGWWLDGLLPVGGLAVLYAAPGSGKSFLALAWAVALAAESNRGLGQPWLGRRTLWSPTVYVAAEGAHGLGVRLRAFLDAHELEPAQVANSFAVLPETVNLMDAAAVRDLVADLRGYFSCNVGLVVIDTLSRAMPGGDENSVKDVSAAIAGADAIRRATNACVLLVHHTQKTGELERGSSALRGAADTMLSLRQEEERLVLEVTKQRNAAPIAPLQLRLVPTSGSCIVAPVEGAAPDAGLTVPRRRVLETLQDIHQDGWAATSLIVRTAHGPGLSERSVYASLRYLREHGYVEKKGSRYALTTRAQDALVGGCSAVAVGARA